MKYNKHLNSDLPDISETWDVAREIVEADSVRIIILADIIARYVEIKLGDQINWLKTYALVALITLGGKLTTSQLAHVMLRPGHSITRLIDSLEKDGHLIRERSLTDRRVINVRVTSEGLAFIKRTIGDIGSINEELISYLNKDELETLKTIFRQSRLRVFENINSAAGAWKHYFRAVLYKLMDKDTEASEALQMYIEMSKDESLIQTAEQELEEIRRRLVD